MRHPRFLSICSPIRHISYAKQWGVLMAQGGYGMKELFFILILSIFPVGVNAQSGSLSKVVKTANAAKIGAAASVVSKGVTKLQKQTAQSTAVSNTVRRTQAPVVMGGVTKGVTAVSGGITVSPKIKTSEDCRKEMEERFENYRKERESKKLSLMKEKMQKRFLSYVRVESQSIDEPSMTSFPLSKGQKILAYRIYMELLLSSQDSTAKITLSDDYYIYIDIPSNVEKEVPSVLFMAHMDVTPEAPGKDIRPIVHENYDGGDIVLPAGITLSPDSPQGAHLKDLKGKTIITSDGSTLLGADDKTGCAVLVTLVEEILRNPKLKHGRVMVLLSQNEDVGKAALRYDPSIFGDSPDVVIDVDGDTYDKFSIANFTAIGQTYYFKGNKAHPNDGKNSGFADALSAAAYFMGLVPPELNPSAREGEEGYVHCYSLSHPLDSVGNPIESDYVVKVRLRYFDPEEGDYQKKLMDENLRKVQVAFPFVESNMTDNQMQYQNIAYSMPSYLPDLIMKASKEAGMPMTPKKSRGGTTSAMMAARFPDQMPGGSDVYSGQNAEHSCYEWCCVEEMCGVVNVMENIIRQLVNLK